MAMVISSRTPEGTPNYCPICRKSICLEPSIPFGDAPCPNCGSLLWFIGIGHDVQFFPFEDSKWLRERMIKATAQVLGVDEGAVRNNPGIWNDSGADSLDLVELVMELEEDSR